MHAIFQIKAEKRADLTSDLRMRKVGSRRRERCRRRGERRLEIGGRGGGRGGGEVGVG